MLDKIKRFLFKNTSSKQTVAKNIVWLSISNFGGRLVKAIVIIYAARVLGTAGYGLFSYAVTLAGFFSLFVDPGINAILIREGSKSSEEERRSLFSTTFAIKLALLAVSVAIILLVAPSFSTLAGAIALLPIVAIVIAGDSLREFFASLMRATEHMQWDAATFLLENVTIVILGFVFLRISPTPLAFMWAYAIGTTVGAFAAAIAVRHHLKNMFSFFSRTLVPKIIVAAWPFAVMTSLGALLTNTDILMISWLKTAADVGIYAAAIRVVQVLYIVPLIIQYTTLPLLSRLAKTDPIKFRSVLEQALALIFLAAIPLSLGGMILAAPIMTVIFGPAYAVGGLAFAILLGSLLFDYAGSTVSNAVFAHDRQKSLIIASAIGAVLNVALDLLLIPRWGIVGSAIATLIAQAASNSYLWHVMKKISYFEILPRLKIIAISGIIMTLGTGLMLMLHLNVIVNVFLSMAIYCGALWTFHEPLLDEVMSLGSFKRRTAVSS